MAKFAGGCQCGGIRYQTDADPLFAAHCQCNDCKKASGTGHATAAAFPEAAVTFTGKAKAYTTATDSGAKSTREHPSHDSLYPGEHRVLGAFR